MTYVVTRKCIGCKDTACATVCPVECFHVGPEMLYIDPDTCIDCDACIVQCPVDAIFHEDDVPEDSISDIALNREMVKTYPVFSNG